MKQFKRMLSYLIALAIIGSNLILPSFAAFSVSFAAVNNGIKLTLGGTDSTDTVISILPGDTCDWSDPDAVEDSSGDGMTVTGGDTDGEVVHELEGSSYTPGAQDYWVLCAWQFGDKPTTLATFKFYYDEENSTFVEYTPPQTYTVSFDANGGSAANPANKTYTTTDETGISEPLYTGTKSDHQHRGWTTTKNDASTKVTFPYVPTGDITLYAFWAENATLTYDINNGSGSAPTAPSNCAVGDKITLPDVGSMIPPAGKTFGGWATSDTAPSAAYEAGATYTLATATNTLYAFWADGEASQLNAESDKTEVAYGDTFTITATPDETAGTSVTITAGTNCTMVGTQTGNTATFTATAATGTATVSVAQPGGNGIAAGNKKVTVTLKKRPVTITATATKVYDGKNTAQLSEVSDKDNITAGSLLSGDAVSLKSFASAQYSTANAHQTAAALTVTTPTYEGNNAEKYDVTLVVNGTITPKEIGLSGTVSKDYDGKDTKENATGTLTASGAENSETITVSNYTGKFNTKNVTANKFTVDTVTLTVTGGNAKAENYKLPAAGATVTGKIEQVEAQFDFTNLSQTVGSISQVTATTKIASDNVKDAVKVEYLVPVITAPAVHCDCGFANKLAHQTDCLWVSDNTESCTCGADENVTLVHAATCAYATDDDANCNCGIGDADAATNIAAGQHAGQTCSYTAAVEGTNWFVWGPVIDPVNPAHTTVENYLKSLAEGTHTGIVRASVDGTGNFTASNEVKDLVLNKSGGGTTGGGGGGSSSYTVKFDAGKNGKITKGNASTSVSSGSKVASSKVPEVTANEGYKFLGWSLDGKKTVDPTEQKITKSVTFTALYVEEAVLNKEDHMAYIKGYENGTFRPGNNITRAEVAAIFSRILKNSTDVAGSSDSNFKDVAADAWYAPYVTVMEQQGLLKGYSDGTFRPDAPITREEFTAMATRVVGVTKAGELPFSDVKSDRWSVDNIFTAYENGWIKGYEDGTFRPEAKLTRAEAVKMVNAMLERTISAESISGASYNAFSDVASSHWAYYDVIEASNAHQYTKEDGKETWTK